MTVHMLTYGSENWTITYKTGSKNTNCRNEIFWEG